MDLNVGSDMTFQLSDEQFMESNLGCMPTGIYYPAKQGFYIASC